MRETPEFDALRRGESIEMEGVTIVPAGDWRDLEPGDWYVGQRNTPPRLGIVRKVDRELRCVFSTNVPRMIYPYDLHEVVRVRIPDLEK